MNVTLPTSIGPSELVPWVTRVLARLGHTFAPGDPTTTRTADDVGGWYVQHERSEWSDTHVMLWMEREDCDNGATSSHAFVLERRVKGELLIEEAVIAFEGFDDIARANVTAKEPAVRDAWVAALREG
ncbi:MAG: hypothetical protein H6721_31970 [Sandaracinus sp.]|nr:hypothetical protein [Sandaracinus sp.]